VEEREMHNNAIHKTQNKVSRADVSIIIKLIVQNFHGTQIQLAEYRAGPTHVGATGRLKIQRPFKPIFFKHLQFQAWQKVLREHAPSADNFRRNSFVCKNHSLPATSFRLFQ
jgi:hypothetical protein